MLGFWLVENKFYSLFCNYTPYTKEFFMRQKRVSRFVFCLVWGKFKTLENVPHLRKPLHIRKVILSQSTIAPKGRNYKSVNQMYPKIPYLVLHHHFFSPNGTMNIFGSKCGNLNI